MLSQKSLMAVVFLVVFSLFSYPAQAVPVLPDFGAATFLPRAPINNPYLPYIPGTEFIYFGEVEEEGELTSERIELLVTHQYRNIMGVDALAVRDRAFEDGDLVEETLDYFAQDTDGNVWYFGEDVINFILDEDGNVIDTNTEGSWIAGENGALPGYLQPNINLFADGFNFYQEFAELDEAVDEATLISRNNLAAIGLGDFNNVLKVFETTVLEPDSREFKHYAPGVGLILIEEGLDENFENPEFTLELISIRDVPEPSALAGLSAGLLLLPMLMSLRRRKR